MAKSKGKKDRAANPIKITANTQYGHCEQMLSPFGGLVGFEKFLDLLKYEEAFEKEFIKPSRKTKLGDFRMCKGIIILLLTGFQRIGQLFYIEEDRFICGMLEVEKLPVVSTFWRYIASLGINQAKSLLRLMGKVRARVWQVNEIALSKVTIDMDTTASTVYGNIEGGRKGYNPNRRGKKCLRPVLAFISETREYLCGKQRKGTTIRSDETADLIDKFDEYLPECVKKILIRADGEFTGWKSISKCHEKGYDFIIGTRAENPSFKDSEWYKHRDYEYNEVEYKPMGWEKPCRFVSMRIKKEKRGDRQLKLFDDYMYRTFVTSLNWRPHNVISEYDGRCNCENFIGEAQREGINAIPSKTFMTNYVFFQIVMMAYNIWRWYKLAVDASGASRQLVRIRTGSPNSDRKNELTSYSANTIRIARLRLLFIAAKIVRHANRDKALYSIFDHRVPELMKVLKWLDRKRSEDTVFRDCSRLTSLKTAG